MFEAMEIQQAEPRTNLCCWECSFNTRVTFNRRKLRLKSVKQLKTVNPRQPVILGITVFGSYARILEPALRRCVLHHLSGHLGSQG